MLHCAGDFSGTAAATLPIIRPMRTLLLAALLAMPFVAVSPLLSQAGPVWQMQDSDTTASLRGIDSVNGIIAWASGTGGMVLRTIDGGAHWQRCATPDAGKDGATLDFRGVQAWDAKTAIVMASGPGLKSRLYKTTDSCKTWKLLFTNPDSPNGFFDCFWFNDKLGILLGDAVRGQMTVYFSENRGKSWKRDPHKGLSVDGRGLSAFAASNRSIAIGDALFRRSFVTGGKDGSVYFVRPYTSDEQRNGIINRMVRKELPWKSAPIPIGSKTESSGAFAVSYRYPITIGICEDCAFDENSVLIAVGGDYTRPDSSTGTAAYSVDGGMHWTASAIPPHGYRSTVQWSDDLGLWVTAGTNGSDLSRDGGKTWQPLDNGNWNALSLPFIVGPNGRVARLNVAVLPKP